MPGGDLGGLESQYRIGMLDREPLISRIRERLDGFDEIWVPAAIGGHADHVAVREMVLAAAQEPEVRSRIRLHADLPYAIALGWPSWVTGEEPDPFLDTDFWLSDELGRAGFPPERLRAHVHVLEPALRAMKESAVLAYRSQLPALRLDPREPVRWNSVLDFEVSWTMPD